MAADEHLNDTQFEDALSQIGETLSKPFGGSSASSRPSNSEMYGGHIQEGQNGLHVGGQPVSKLYRVVDPGEWQDAQTSGGLQSRGGYTRASAQPDERWRHQGESGQRGHTLEIDYHPDDQWRASAEGYAATRARIPLNRVRKVG